MMKPLMIGSLRIDVPVLLAPMEGYTHAPFRALCRKMGAGLTYTELTAAKNLKLRIPRDLDQLATDPEERPVAAHLYGKEPEDFAAAAALVTEMQTFDVIDLNAGCPVSNVVERGEGAGLMKTPELMCKILQALRGATDLPVTVKTRIGTSPKEVNALEVLKAAEEGGASAITFHARLTVNRHRGLADWGLLAQLKREARIPVIGNGGLETPEDVVRLFRETGVDGVMIGQAAIGNPWIFRAAHRALTFQPYEPPNADERFAVIEEHVRTLVAQIESRSQVDRRIHYSPEETAVRFFRAHLVRYVADFPDSLAFRQTLHDMYILDDLLAACRRLMFP